MVGRLMQEDTVSRGRSPDADKTGKKLFSACGLLESRVLCRSVFFQTQAHLLT